MAQVDVATYEIVVKGKTRYIVQYWRSLETGIRWHCTVSNKKTGDSLGGFSIKRGHPSQTDALARLKIILTEGRG